MVSGEFIPLAQPMVNQDIGPEGDWHAIQGAVHEALCPPGMGHVDPTLHALLRDKLRELDCMPIATGGVEDHVHVLCQMPPTLSVSELVKRLKGPTSHL